MGTTLRMGLMAASIFLAIWILSKIRKNKIRQEDGLFWVCLALLMALLGIFPQVAYFFARLLGIQSPANFVFALLFSLLIEKMFSLSIQASKLEEKEEALSAELALRTKALEEREKKDIGKGAEKITGEEERLLIVIPAFNEEEMLPRLVMEIQAKCPRMDYVIVNDGSTDRTRKVCADHGLNVMDLPVNVGLGGAIRSGMRYANYYDYDYVVQIDGDGQHDPAYIGDLLRCMREEGADIVIGSRFKERRKPLTLRMIGSQLITCAIRLTTGGTYIGDVTSGMRLFNKRMIKRFAYRINYRPEPDTLAYLINQGIKIEEVQVEMRERRGGESYLRGVMSFWYMLHVLFNIFIFQWVRKD